MQHLLLLHGALGAGAQFDALKAILPQHLPVHAPDLPGHGSRAPEEIFSLEMFSNALLQYLDEHKIESAAIFGYSMGGYAALHLAMSRPERIQSIVTYGTKLDWTPEIAARMTGMVDSGKIEAKAPALAAYLSEMHADWKMLCAETADFMRLLGNGGGLQERDFAHIPCPVTIIRGEADNVVTEEESRRTAALIPRGNFHSLPEGLHPFEKVAPEKIGELILRFA